MKKKHRNFLFIGAIATLVVALLSGDSLSFLDNSGSRIVSVVMPTSGRVSSYVPGGGGGGGSVVTDEGTVGFTVYSDVALSVVLDSFDWGVIGVGESTSQTCYIVNSGDTGVFVDFVVETQNWVPVDAEQSVSVYLVETVESYSLAVGGVVELSLVLEVSEDVWGVNGFGFDIVFTGVYE